MKKEMKIARYLRRLERELSTLPADDRATVVAEVKGLIDKARAQGRTVDDALNGLGAPKLMAMSYLKRCPGHESRSRWVRASAFATVGFFALVFMGGLAVIWRLSPLAPENGVGWWGPALRLDEPSGHVRVLDTMAAPTLVESPTVVGSRNLADLKIKKVRLPFQTGKLELKTSANAELKWSCQAPLREEPRVEIADGTLTLDLGGSDVARCVIEVPADAKVEVRGVNGHLEVKRLVAALDVQLTNGRVSFDPDPARVSDVEVHVKNGLQDFFRRSSKPGAIKTKIVVTNGTVKKE